MQTLPNRNENFRVEHFGKMLLATMIVCVIALGSDLSAKEPGAISPTTSLLASGKVKDQDDMCVWIDPVRRERSVVITSDKSASKVFVYDLQGEVLQVVDVTKPGNIDIRQNVTLGNRKVDLVVVNQRADGFKLVVFQVNGETRQLQRLDANDLLTGPNYGGCLYHSRKTGQLYFICTSEVGMVEQYELLDRPERKIGHRKVRNWPVGKCEGAVADDEAGTIFISEETKGVWRFPAEPNEPAIGSLIAKVEEGGLKGDVEGLALVKQPDGTGFLIVSDQGANRYVVHQRQPPHAVVGEFQIDGASQTDGIEVVTTPLGDAFPQGFFACHTDREPRPVLLTPWQKIAEGLVKSGTPTTRAAKP